jgi:hypothetical protein
MSWQLKAPAALSQAKEFALRGQGEPQKRFGIRILSRSAIQPVASRYTDWAIPAPVRSLYSLTVQWTIRSFKTPKTRISGPKMSKRK